MKYGWSFLATPGDLKLSLIYRIEVVIFSLILAHWEG